MQRQRQRHHTTDRQTVQKLKDIRIGIHEKVEILNSERLKIGYYTDSRCGVFRATHNRMAR